MRTMIAEGKSVPETQAPNTRAIAWSVSMGLVPGYAGSLSVRSDHARASYDDGRLTIADEAVTIVLVADADLQTIEDGQFGFVLVEDEELVDA